MIVYTGTRKPELPDRPSAVTLGKFDGLHRGHRLLIDRLKKFGEEGFQTIVFTFDMSPVQVVTGRNFSTLMTVEERRTMLEEFGVDSLVEFPFDHDTMCMDAEEFVRTILIDCLHARKIVIGEDFCFGYRRSGNAKLLASLQEKYGYELTVIPKIQDGDRDISSTYIREEVEAGRMEKANELLGYDYSVTGEIVHGRHMGHSLGFPTINVMPETSKLLPPFGVYYTEVVIDGSLFHGVTNIGRKPTIAAGEAVGVETHLLDAEGDFYGRTASVRLLHWARPEMKFETFADLTERVLTDKANAREYFHMD